MIDVTFKLHWFSDSQEWRGIAADNTYWTSKDIDGLPKAVRGMLRSVGDEFMRHGEDTA